MSKLYDLGNNTVELAHMQGEPTVPEFSSMIERLPNSEGGFVEYETDQRIVRMTLQCVVDTTEEIAFLQSWRSTKESGLVFEDQDGTISGGWRIRPDYPIVMNVIEEGMANRRANFQIEKYI